MLGWLQVMYRQPSESVGVIARHDAGGVTLRPGAMTVWVLPTRRGTANLSPKRVYRPPVAVDGPVAFSLCFVRKLRTRVCNEFDF